MKFMIVFAILLIVAQANAQTSSKPAVVPAGADKINCNSPPDNKACSIIQTKRVYFDSKNNVCKLIEEKGTCALNPQNQFATISACKYKCIIPNNKKNTTPKA